jgi:hypothetical protein
VTSLDRRAEPPILSPRRRFQFRLRTVFLIVAIVAIECAVCLPMLREWKERDEYRREQVRRTIHFMSASPRAQEPAIKAALTWLRHHSD